MELDSRMADPVAVNSDPAPGPEPGASFSFMQMLPTLVVDVAMPIITFNVLTHNGVSTLWALAAGGLFPALNNFRVWVTARKLEPLGIIVMIFLVIGTAGSLISGSVFFMLIKESVLTATFGFICLGSILAERPLMFYINRQFVAGGFISVSRRLVSGQCVPRANFPHIVINERLRTIFCVSGTTFFAPVDCSTGDQTPHELRIPPSASDDSRRQM